MVDAGTSPRGDESDTRDTRMTALRRTWEASFAGRCVRSFLAVQGLDRAVVIASQAFTALIPLLLLASALLPSNDATRVSDALVRRLGLEGGAAASVERVFAQPEPGAVGVLSLVLLVLSGVSLTRRLQRMYLTAWRLDPTAGVRGSLSAAVGLAVMLVEIALLSTVRGLAAQLRSEWALSVPISLVSGFVLWTSIPWLLLDRRVAWRRLVPTGLLAGAAASVYGLASTVYMPPLVENYSERYGLFGVTLALVSWLLAVSVILVVTTTVAAELDRAPEPWAARVRRALRIDEDRDRPGYSASGPGEGPP
jgi:uncharacterized BrkB/YihY/UPF0761 family membrane protein